MMLNVVVALVNFKAVKEYLVSLAHTMNASIQVGGFGCLIVGLALHYGNPEWMVVVPVERVRLALPDVQATDSIVSKELLCLVGGFFGGLLVMSSNRIFEYIRGQWHVMQTASPAYVIERL